MSDTVDVLMPLEQEGSKSVVRAWLRAVGDHVSQDEPLVEIETDKVAVEVSAPAAGVLHEIVLDIDAEAPPGALLGRLRPIAAVANNTSRVSQSAEAQPPRQSTDQARLSPLARRLLAEHGLQASDIAPSGRDGRLTHKDVLDFVETRKRASSELQSNGKEIPTPVVRSSSRAGRIVPHGAMRKSIAEHMARSVATAPHVTAVFEADFSAVAAHRRIAKAALEREGVALTFASYIVRAACEAMQASPNVNSRWHDDHLEIFEHINMGVGVSLGDQGLIVPVIAQADTLSLADTARRLHELTQKARAGKLTPSEVQNGTFTISNHGVSGSLIAAPIIINQPQAAILGVGKVEKRMVVRTIDGADALQIRPMAYVTLTIDHRVLDGHQTNTWLSRFVEVLEGWPEP